MCLLADVTAEIFEFNNRSAGNFVVYTVSNTNVCAIKYDKNEDIHDHGYIVFLQNLLDNVYSVIVIVL